MGGERKDDSIPMQRIQRIHETRPQYERNTIPNEY